MSTYKTFILPLGFNRNYVVPLRLGDDYKSIFAVTLFLTEQHDDFIIAKDWPDRVVISFPKQEDDNTASFDYACALYRKGVMHEDRIMGSTRRTIKKDLFDHAIGLHD